MNTSNYLRKNTISKADMPNGMKNYADIYAGQLIKTISTGIKSIDLLVNRYCVYLNSDENELADNAFQKSLILYGQDQRLDYVNLPPCMYMIIAGADATTKFVIHRLYLPYKNGVRFATYLLNEDGDVIESVCYQRNSKYLRAFKVIRMHIIMANDVFEVEAA
nr:hypothetical protein [uncultured Glaciecola sp.]